MSEPTTSADVAIIGGGFYGLYLAQYLARRAGRVVLCEQSASLMRRASYGNQARVHGGYHYPRSVLTAVRSRVNFPRFVEEFRPAIDTTFEKVYAIGRQFSKITSDQFFAGMQRIGAPIRKAPDRIAGLFDPTYVEASFLTEEYAFDANKLGRLLADRVLRAGVDVRMETTVTAVGPAPGGGVRVTTAGRTGTTTLDAGNVFCCGYAQLNVPAAGGGLPIVPLKHELTELALVDPPESLRGLGVTVMDGPFFSLMPFPAEGAHTLSHVRYTPHAQWYDAPDGGFVSAYDRMATAELRTAFPHMVRDAARFLPAAVGCRYRKSLWEVKTILPRSESDDSRPILFRPHFGIPNYHLVMGGKIDNVYDVVAVVGETFGWD